MTHITWRAGATRLAGGRAISNAITNIGNERTFRPPSKRVKGGSGFFDLGRPLQRASDLSTRRQRKGHAMVTTGTED